MKLQGKYAAALLGAVLVLCAQAPMLQAQEQAAAGIVAGQPKPEVIKTFQALEDNWSTALVRDDQYGMELLLSPYFEDISAAGDVQTRDEFLAFRFQKNASRPFSMEQKVASVRIFGDVAIVSGTYQIKIDVNGDPRLENGVFTHIYVQTHGRWLCVNSQRTNVIDEPLNHTKRRHRKR
jgi:ketosteroid isomerase-like protein